MKKILNKSLRDISITDAFIMRYLNAGKLYHLVNGVFPNSFIDFIEYDPEEALKILKEKFELDNDSLLVKKYQYKDQIEKFSFFIAKLPENRLLLFDQNSEAGESVTYSYCDEQGEAFVKEMKQLLAPSIKKKTNNSLYMLSKKYDSFDFRPFDMEDRDYSVAIEKHYNDDFIAVDEEIKKAVNENKTGLILLHGKPGTGKTSYLRSLIAQTNRKVIYIPSEMAGTIGSPGFVDALCRKKGSILFVEDAELALLERGQGSDTAAVSTLLNITDGFLSDVLKLTVFCTFNTKWENIDNALTRKGRIIAKYNFDQLEAKKVKELIGDKLHPTDIGKAMTISDVFNYEATEYVMKPVKIGF